jgi:hypothetical protein
MADQVMIEGLFQREEAELTRFIHEELDLPIEDKVTVESWVDEQGGYRISEISTWHPQPEKCNGCGYGGSWMQSDPGAAAALFAAERFVISRSDVIDYLGGDDYIDYRQECEQSLRYAITDPPTFGVWEDRR